MHRRGAKVTWKENADPHRLPDRLSEGVALVLDLARRELLETIGQRILIRREGGYCGFDVLLFLLFYFAAGTAVGIRKFWDLVRPCTRQLAALAGRKKLPSPASLSRALDAAEPQLLRPATEWLLSEGAGIDAVLRHPSVQTYDAQGTGWHVFDFDPTVTTLRHRALPEGNDLPAPRRRSAATAAPGYSGRKRGDVQFRRGTLQHAGSSAWLYGMLGPGNGDGHAELNASLEVVVRTCTRLGHPLARALLRVDGEFGWVPYLAASRAHGVPLLTRLNRHALLEQPEVVRALREGPWHFVPDSRSGPRRSALDLGVVTVPPGQQTRRADGTEYEPVAVRVVVSRYPRTGEAEHGRVIDGWQYELFVVDAPADALPAPDAVAQYFGRAGQENRFAQEDREVGLDRIVSYHLPGQELAVIVGLWVWNLRLVRGYELAPPPAVRPTQELYVAELDVRGIIGAGDAPATQSADIANSPPTPQPVHAPSDRAEGIDPEGGMPQPVQAQSTPDAEPFIEHCSDAPAASDGPISETQTNETSAVGEAEMSADAPRDKEAAAHLAPASGVAAGSLADELSRIGWDEALRSRPGWSWDSATGHLRCPAGRDLVLTTARKGALAKRLTGIIFCRPPRGCHPCAVRAACLRSTLPSVSKHAEVNVPTLVAARLRELLRTHRHLGRRVTVSSKDQPGAGSTSKRPRVPFPIAALPPAVPLLAVLSSLFLPAAARNLLRAAASRLSVSVIVHEPAPKPRLALVAASAADRQHRRMTWQQHFERHALDSGAQVEVEITGDHRLRDMLEAGHCEQAAG